MADENAAVGVVGQPDTLEAMPRHVSRHILGTFGPQVSPATDSMSRSKKKACIYVSNRKKGKLKLKINSLRHEHYIVFSPSSPGSGRFVGAHNTPWEQNFC